MNFCILKNKRGQGNAIEYAVVFFMVAAVVAGMSTYAKRGVQAMIRGARNFMWMQVNEVYNQEITNSALPVEYEPYYVNTQTIKLDNTTQTESVKTWAGHEGVYQSGINSVISSTTHSDIASPLNAE